jgi:hypothetical protein
VFFFIFLQHILNANFGDTRKEGKKSRTERRMRQRDREGERNNLDTHT